MVSVRAAKQKGANFEFSVRDSLKAIFPDIQLTRTEGYIQQYDLVTHRFKTIFECKRHKGFSWNELMKTFNKLKNVAPQGYASILVFQGNRQPVLCMGKTKEHNIVIGLFENQFGVPFIKHVGETKIRSALNSDEMSIDQVTENSIKAGKSLVDNLIKESEKK